MKICLIKCASPFLIDERVFPPLGLMAVGTALKRDGHEILIAEKVVSGFDGYGFGPTTPEYQGSVRMLREVREVSPKAKTVIGGPHASSNDQACLHDGFDVVVTGDGEPVASQAFASGGLVLHGNGNVDEYPLIDRRLVDIWSYRYFINGIAATTLVTARGCPYKCAFCSKTSATVRYRSPESVIDEIRYLHVTHGFHALMFFDDTFIIDPDRTLEICDELKRLGIVWRCFVRADLVVRHGASLLNRMHDAGCVEVGMGIESGSDAILKTIKKGETVSDIMAAVALLHDAGIRVKGFFIVGLPGESNETLGETRRLLDDIRLDDADFTIFKPYAGSDIVKNKQLYDIDWVDTPKSLAFYKGKPGEYNCNVWTSGLSQNDIWLARSALERRYGFISHHPKPQ